MESMIFTFLLICFSDTSDMEEDGGEDSKSVKTNDENKK